MNITQTKQQVKDTVEAYLQKDEMGIARIAPARQRPLFLLGAPGIGKTAIMEQVAQELGIGLVSYSMTHHTRQSALGLPAIVSRSFDGMEYEASEYTMSEIIASIYDYMQDTGLRSGILFLDEVNCVSETLYPSMLQFLQFKTFGRHALPEDWVVVCAGNPPEYNRSVHEFDIVTLDRLRKIDIEPDYNAWKAYANDMGTHPAITTFLEVKNDNFYSVESTPSGKSFVTARSWSDLSDVMTLFEDLGKTVDINLFQQFLQDDEIATRFAAYYELFNKYRSDYQVDSILAGKASDEVMERAQAAPFDENIALISLVLDALVQEMVRILEQEAALVLVRDELRAIKDQVIAGESLIERMSAKANDWEREISDRMLAQSLTMMQLHARKRAVPMMRGLIHGCEVLQAASGKAAFDVVSTQFAQIVTELQDAVLQVESKIAHAYGFMEEAYGEDREVELFTTELTARDVPSQFINRFGSDAYYAHNDVLMLDSHEQNLKARIDQMSESLGLHASLKKADPPFPQTVGSVEGSHHDMSASAERPLPSIEQVLTDYYAGSQFEFGLPSLCKMTLPADLKGKTVLDLGCRRGKGVFKLSERVGQKGRVIGVEWIDSYVEEAKQKMERAWRDTGLEQNNMEFYKAYPEDLKMAPIPDESVDMIFVNSVSNLFFDREAAFKEMHRVLKPGGCIVNETVLAGNTRDEQVVIDALAIGNSVQAAPDKVAYEDMLARAGFESVCYSNEEPVLPTKGALPERPADTVPTQEDVAFTAVVATIEK